MWQVLAIVVSAAFCNEAAILHERVGRYEEAANCYYHAYRLSDGEDTTILVNMTDFVLLHWPEFVVRGHSRASLRKWVVDTTDRALGLGIEPGTELWWACCNNYILTKEWSKALRMLDVEPHEGYRSYILDQIREAPDNQRRMVWSPGALARLVRTDPL